MNFIQVLSILLYFIIFFLIIFDKKLIISIYLIILPTNGFFPSQYNFLGLFNLRTYVGILAILYLTNIYYKNHNIYRYQTRFQLLSKNFLILLMLYIIVAQFKLAFFDLFNRTIQGAVYDFFRVIVLYGPLYFIIKLVNIDYFKKYIFFSIYFSIIFLVLSAQFTVSLYNLGFEIPEEEFTESYKNVLRLIGFYGGGDVNSLGGFLAISIGYFLAIIEKNSTNKWYFIFIIIAIWGVLLTLSRAAFISVLLVFVYFFYKNNFKKLSILFSLLILLFVFISLPITDILFDRFHNIFNEIDVDEKYSRTARWIYFLKYCTSTFLRIVRGGDSVYYMPGLSEYRDPHNFLIRAFYYTGVFFFLAFIVIFYKFIRDSIKYKTLFDNFYIIAPLIITLTFISQVGHFLYFVIFLSSNKIIGLKK